MAINIMNSLIAAGVGVADEYLEKYDADNPPGSGNEFAKKQSIARLVLAGGGYALQVFTKKQRGLGVVLSLAATPLLVKSISKSVNLFSARQLSAGRGWRPEMITPTQSRPVSGWSPRAVGA